MMDTLDMDQSSTKKSITWVHNISVPMVPVGYWTEECIQLICKEPNTIKEHEKSKSKYLDFEKENMDFSQTKKFPQNIFFQFFGV